MGTLSRHRQDWDDLATVDPYWAVVTDMERKHGRWDREEFFATGQREVDATLALALSLAGSAGRREALDFGCGLGRLTRGLARHFDHVIGVDISEQMIAQARRLNADIPNCDFRLGQGDDLAMFADRSLDLVLSHIVLQHQPNRRLIRRYIAEFVRLVRPGGVVVFQLPTRIPLRNRIQPRRKAYAVLRRLGLPPDMLYRRLGLDPMRMTFMPSKQVTAAVEQVGGRVLGAQQNAYGGGFPSVSYIVTREPAR